MFTADGELREEHRHRQEMAESAAVSPGNRRTATSSPAAQPPGGRPPAIQPPAARPEAAQPEGPGFLDLIGLLAEPASVYLREAQSADPQTAAQSLELARLHIDLLIVLQDKTQGNLSSSEQAMLENVVHQLRSACVGLRG